MSVRIWGRFDGFARAIEASGGAAPWLLERWREQGERFLDECRGSFAVVLEDPARQLALVARDGMGNGYASYRLGGATLEVARDDAELAESAGGAEDLDSLRLTEFYGYQELSGPRTFFRGVQAVLPGEMLIVERGMVRRRRLPRPRLDLEIRYPRWEDYVERFAELLRAAVARCLEGVESAAVMMSGGLDSTPIAAWAARLLPERDGRPAVTALTWRVSDPRGDEVALALETAGAAGIPLECIDCDDAAPFSELAAWPIHPSTPDQTAYRWFHQRTYARAAALGHRILLAGFGGDMLYGNAKRWAWDLLAAEGPGRALDRLREVAAEIGPARTLRSHVLSPLLPRRRALRRGLPEYLTAEARARLEATPLWPAGVEHARRPRQAQRLLALLDAQGGNVERFYSEPFGIEQRLPLRDFDLVQFMLAVPDHLLQQGNETRPVLRAATRGLIPESVRTRRDKGNFIAVLERGLAAERLRWARPLLLHADALWRGRIRESVVRGWLDELPEDDWGRLGFLNALNGELWRRRRAGEPPPSPEAPD